MNLVVNLLKLILMQKNFNISIEIGKMNKHITESTKK